jgi:hypothetical protein
MRLPLIALHQEVGYRISVFSETFKQISRSPDPIHSFGCKAEPMQFFCGDLGVLWHSLRDSMLFALFSQPSPNFGCSVVDTKRAEQSVKRAARNHCFSVNRVVRSKRHNLIYSTKRPDPHSVAIGQHKFICYYFSVFGRDEFESAQRQRQFSVTDESIQ